jgi:GNAT superfamily N-acetyltransferase
VQLREELVSDLSARYGVEARRLGITESEDAVVFLVARDADGTLLGCGWLHSLGEPVAEIRDMYVRPEARGRGVGSAVLQELERRAVESGFKVLRLETGPLQPEALGLFGRTGYREIPCFGGLHGVPGSRCFERRVA